MSPDPLADKASGWTPYRYGFNNPVRLIDPDGRFEVDKATAEQYKKFTAYLRNLSKLYKGKSDKFKNAFKRFSQLDDSQVESILNFGSGPKIVIEDLKGANGVTPFKMDSDGNHFSTGEIKIDIDIIKNFEANYDNLFGDQSESKVAELALESTLFHEATHYGDIVSDGKLNMTGMQKTAFGMRVSKTGDEGGKSFEVAAYGRDLLHDQKTFSGVRRYVNSKYPNLSSGPVIQQDNTRVNIIFPR